MVPGDPGPLRCLGEDRLNGGVAWRNDRVRSGVITEAVEDSLIYANQTQLAGDNPVSVNGTEEDGVDNRVEAPSRTPGEGSGSASSSEGSEAAAGDNSEAAGTSASPSAGPPAPGQSPSQTAPSHPLPSQTVPSLMSAQPPAANGSGSQGSGWGGTSPMAAVSGVASGARGLAAKVGA